MCQLGMQGHRRAAPGAAVVALLATQALFGLGCRGEPKALEPRAPPARQAPPVAIPELPVAAGYGRVVLHGTDGAMQITARSDTSFVPPGHPVPPNRTGDLCTTPCVADLPIGRYKLYMTSADGSYSRGDTDMLDVREGTNYYLRAPGRFEEPEWIPILPSVIVAVGVVALLSGAALVASDDGSQRTGGIVLMGGGIGIGILGGILAYDASRGAIQEGATTTWAEPPLQGATP
jgi:hypothetical protein